MGSSLRVVITWLLCQSEEPPRHEAVLVRRQPAASRLAALPQALQLVVAIVMAAGTSVCCLIVDSFAVKTAMS
jgi:hypothetical protein